MVKQVRSETYLKHTFKPSTKFLLSEYRIGIQNE